MEEHDLLIVADATFSMNAFWTSLHKSLPQIISVSALTGCFSRIGLISYRDYCDRNTVEWSGWLDTTTGDENRGTQPNLVEIAKQVEPLGGGDYPEAVKTALAKAYEIMRPEAKTLILIYTDAPPHNNDPRASDHENWKSEREALSAPESYGSYGPLFVDWVSAAKTLRSGEKKAQVFAILDRHMARHCMGYFLYLCAITNGACVIPHDSGPDTISKTTIELLLAWMGVEKPYADQHAELPMPSDLSRYISHTGIMNIDHEDDQTASNFFCYPYKEKPDCKANIVRIPLSSQVLREDLPKKPVPALDPAKRWVRDPGYKKMAAQHLMRIIREDVQAISINPVFGSLWRAVCTDRMYSGRDDLVNAFSKSVGEISLPNERKRMTVWLNESYNQLEEVLTYIQNVPHNKRFPCVYLDPTLDFSQVDKRGEDQGENRAITDFTRDELLEIGRSCDPRILRRLGRVLTRLSFVSQQSDMPEHIALMDSQDVPRIPLALADQKHDQVFWRVLLHVIVPGTLLSPRPAAVLAALSLRLGIAPLTEVAESAMLSFKNKWASLDMPETWSISCMSLLLDTEKTYQKNLNRLKTVAEGGYANEKPARLLNELDCTVFERLVALKTIQHNLDVPLIAHIPWTPNKFVSVMGPLAVCQKCKSPRSVTIMGDRGICGICYATDPDRPMDYGVAAQLRISSPATSQSDAHWVECCISTCRAQYVVYNVEGLNVRAKCHYCRIQGAPEVAKSAPTVQCQQCYNRMIWPEEYRPSSFLESSFVCPPCTTGRPANEEAETTANKLASENTLSWLTLDRENPVQTPLLNRSPYHTISALGIQGFLDRIQLFPPRQSPLTLLGKPIQNTSALIGKFQDLVAGRKTEKMYCSLCFSTFWPSALIPACGRRGCLQRVCSGCLSGWYGSNRPGCIINAAALACPFCRRFPTPRTMAKHGAGFHAIQDLCRVVNDPGIWIYACCVQCLTAKEFVERSCSQAMPPEVTDWKCTECIEENARRRLEQQQRATGRDGLAQQPAGETAAITGPKCCPGCGTMVEKISGCGHIICPVPNCGVHWCYFCGKQTLSADDTYSHMVSEHGTIYDQEGTETEDEDEDEN